MITQDQVDLDLLQNSGVLLRNYFIETSSTERKPVEIFMALLDLTVEYIGAGLDGTQMVFDAEDICNKSQNPKEDYSSAKEFINRHRKGFDKFIEDNIEKIEHYCRLKKIKFLPTINNTESAGGVRTLFYIGLKPLSNEITQEVEATTSKKGSIPQSQYIIYTVPQLPKAPTWAKPLLRFELIGWKFKLYFMLPILAVLLGYGLVMWNLFSLSTTSLLATCVVGIAVYFAVCFLKPFYDAVDLKVSMAPQWLLNFSTLNAQIRYEKTGELKPNGRPVRALELVVYKAKCPICGNDVEVTEGKYTNKGRLIGVCEESPREHTFSFDHVTKKGRLLRE